jgi:hypothetical protein
MDVTRRSGDSCKVNGGDTLLARHEVANHRCCALEALVHHDRTANFKCAERHQHQERRDGGKLDQGNTSGGSSKAAHFASEFCVSV